MSLKGDLRRPRALRAAAATTHRHESQPAALEETHISWVFLFEDDVFKVKRPVSLGFLDFSTLEARRAACEAEIRLNRRLAPDVYRDLVPVVRGRDGTHAFGGDGDVVDWAVHMRRLPDARRADHMVESGALNRPTIDSIAARIAAFHASLPTSAATAAYGSVDAIRRNVEESFATMKDSLASYVGEADARAIEEFQRATLDARAAVFAARVAAGRVRDGHGDLRLEHVYLELDHDGPTIIDCIEFSDRFRYADVCADVAFLSMDLSEHGRVDLSERLLATYAREANDFDLYALVDFYSSYRAFVRGKVSHLLAEDDDVAPAARRRARREARRCFLLALASARRPILSPVVVAVGGIIGSGKSTISDRLASELSAPVVDADRTRKALIGVRPTDHLTEPSFRGAYDLAFTEKVYAEVLRRADVVLASGRPVIVDASFRSAHERARVRELASKHGVPFRMIECRVPPSVAKDRLRERESRGGVSDGRLEIFDSFCSRFEPMTELAAAEHVVLDTSRALEASLSDLCAVIETWPTGLVG